MFMYDSCTERRLYSNLPLSLSYTRQLQPYVNALIDELISHCTVYSSCILPYHFNQAIDGLTHREDIIISGE